MKNLFKNLMLVAVAAMAFTACSEDNNEVNKAEKKTTLEFVASFDGDTRSGFTGSSENENGKVVYHSEWFGGETVMLVAGDQVKTATVDAEGKFTATFDGVISQIDIYTPMESFYKPYMDYNFYQVNPEVLAEQTPLANSVDPKVHVAKGYAMVDGEGNQIIPVSLAHEVAYGKMTVKGVDFKINKVKLSFNGGTTYTINADNVENNTFWFAAHPMNVTEFTVTAYDAEGKAVTKTVDVAAADKTLAFNYGRVSTFSVSLETPEEPAAPSYSSAKASGYYHTDFTLYFYAEDEKLETLKLNPCSMASSDWTIAPGTYYFGQSGSIFYEGQFSTYGDTYLYGGKVEISVVNGQYHFEFIDLADKQGNVVLVYATYTGEIAGLNVPDLRTPLATPTNVTATAEANIITIKWDAVEGADGYRVKLYSPYDEYKEEIVTTNEYVYEAKLYNTKYSFTIMSYASDENENKSSDDAYVDVTTGKDPNSFADYELDYVTVSSNYFEFNRDWNNGSANTKTSLRIYMHNNDKGDNYINPGHYNCLGQGANTPSSAGNVNLRYCTDTWQYYYSTANSSSYLDVEIVDGQYVIIATIDGKTWGYKGLPGDWIIPDVDDSGEGGDSGDSGEGDPTDPEKPLDSVTINSVDFSNPKSPSFNDGLLTFEMYYTGWSVEGTYNLTTNTENSYVNRSIYNVKVNGQPATTVSGAVKVTYGNDYYVVYTFDNVVINGITFTGSAKKYY